jgi:hypothetical protein
MMGVSLSGPTYVYGDNTMYVVHNTHHPESILTKKSNLSCYDAVHEWAAMGESIIGHVVLSVDNPADICTRVVPGGQKLSNIT